MPPPLNDIVLFVHRDTNIKSKIHFANYFCSTRLVFAENHFLFLFFRIIPKHASPASTHSRTTLIVA